MHNIVGSLKLEHCKQNKNCFSIAIFEDQIACRNLNVTVMDRETNFLAIILRLLHTHTRKMANKYGRIMQELVFFAASSMYWTAITIQCNTPCDFEYGARTKEFNTHHIQAHLCLCALRRSSSQMTLKHTTHIATIETILFIDTRQNIALNYY